MQLYSSILCSFNSLYSLLSEACSTILYIVPYLQNWDASQPIPAGALKMKHVNAWPPEVRFKHEIQSHFVCIDTKDLPSFPDMRTNILQHYQTVIRKLQCNEFVKNLPVETSNCMNTITKFRRYVIDEENEATIRLLYANPVTLLICTMNGYMFKVEDRVIELAADDDDDDNVDLHSAISSRSVADHICYSIHGEKRIVAGLKQSESFHVIHLLSY